MSVEIHIIGDYYMRSDPYQWIISTKRGVDKDGKQKWSNLSFHSSPKQAISSISSVLARGDNSTTLNNLLENVETRFPALSHALAEAELITETINMELAQ